MSKRKIPAKVTIKTAEDFTIHTAKVEDSSWYRRPQAFGFFSAQTDMTGHVISGHFIHLNIQQNFGTAAMLLSVFHDLYNHNFRRRNEYVADLNEAIVTRMLASFKPFIADAAGDLHVNVQALMAIEQAIKLARTTLFKVVFMFNHAASVASLEAAYLKLACHEAGDEDKAFPTVVAGMRDILPELYWNGDIAIQPAELMLHKAFYPLHGIKQTLHRIPPYMPRMREEYKLLRLIEREY